MSSRIMDVATLCATYARFGLRVVKSDHDTWLFETGWKTPITLHATLYPGEDGEVVAYFNEMQIIVLEMHFERHPPPANWNGKRGQ